MIDGPVVDYLGYAALHHAPPDSKVSVGPEEFFRMGLMVTSAWSANAILGVLRPNDVSVP